MNGYNKYVLGSKENYVLSTISYSRLSLCPCPLRYEIEDIISREHHCDFKHADLYS